MAFSAKVEASVRRDFLVAAVMAAIGIALCAELWGYAAQARIFPLYLAGTMILCGAGVAWSALRRSRNMAELPKTEAPDPAKEAAELAATRAGILRGALPLAVVLI